MFEETISFIRNLYNTENFIPLHAPVFLGNEKKYLTECIESTFVSYVGKYVKQFEDITADFTGSKYAVAVVNGTAALQIALKLAGVSYGDEVITQPLTFVATCNAIKHNGAYPVFIDVDLNNLGLSPEKLESFLKNHAIRKSGLLLNKITDRPIKAVVPVHVFGHPCLIEDILDIASQYGLKVIEDSAESLGSYFKNKHTGIFGEIGILSYNGNKTITTGGGGMILTNNNKTAELAKHITTTAKVPHKFEYVHDMVGYNYRLTNVSAALGFAQMEYINKLLANKRKTAHEYEEFFKNSDIRFLSEPENSKSNYWLNTVLMKNQEERNIFLEETNNAEIMTRPAWRLMNKLDMFSDCFTGNLDTANMLEERIVNIPSSYREI